MEAATGWTFRQWGVESLTELKTDFKLSGSLYAESLTQRFPSYAWGQGVMFSALTAACKEDPAYVTETKALADELHTRYWCTQNGTSGYNAGSGACGDRYYDDNAWIALALIELYEVTRETKYLDRAKATVAFSMSGENGPGDTPPGGIRWHESSTGGSSVCAGAPTSLANLLLYQITGIESYKTDGERIYEWLRTCGLHQYSSGLYHEVNEGALGYLTGVMTQCAVRLHQITGSTVYLTEAQRLAAAMEHEFITLNTHALRQTGKWGGHDMTNGFVELYKVDGNRHWLDVAAGYVEFLHTNCKDAASGRYTTSWDDVGGTPSSALIDNASAARAFWKLAQTVGGEGPEGPDYVNIRGLASARCFRLNNSQTADNTTIVLYDLDTTFTSEKFTLVDLGNGYYGIRSWTGNKALQPLNNQSANNTSVVIYTASSTQLSQQWYLIDCGGGYFNIQNRLTGKSIVPYNSGTGNNTTLVTYTTNLSQTSQQWQFVGLTVPTSIMPYVSVNGGAWEQLGSVTLEPGDNVSLKGQITGSGTFTWQGPDGLNASGSEISLTDVRPKKAGRYIVTCTNAAGAKSYADFQVTVTAPVTLYQHCDYTGWSARFGVGAYNLSELIAAGAINNDSSSIKVEPGYRVIFYDSDNFAGTTRTWTATDACFVNENWNDRLTSFVVEPIEDPVAYWTFNESSGTIAMDTSPQRYDGTLKNMTGNEWTLGKACHGLEFDGIDDYVEPSGFMGIPGGAGRTCSAWIKTTKAGCEILGWGSLQTGRKWVLRVDDAGTLRAEVWGGYVRGTKVINDGTWHHVAVTFFSDGTPNIAETLLYVDGAADPVALSSACAVDTDYVHTLSIGSFRGPVMSFYDGIMDDVRIYARALSGADIWELYAAQALTADMEPDGDVDLTDFAFISDAWQAASAGAADLTCDGTIAFDDFMILADEWLRSIQ